MNSKELLTEETVNRIDLMLRKLASMKINNGHLRMDFEDAVSELWINVLKIVERTGNVDLNYIASASFNKMVDLTRYNIRREATPYTNENLNQILPEEVRNSQMVTEGRRSDAYIFSTSSYEDVSKRLELVDILNLFEEGSNEYKFVEAWMRILGILEDIDHNELPEKAFDRYIAVDVLGYAGSNSSGYSRVRSRVRRILTEAGYRL